MVLARGVLETAMQYPKRVEICTERLHGLSSSRRWAWPGANRYTATEPTATESTATKSIVTADYYYDPNSDFSWDFGCGFGHPRDSF